MFIEPSDERSHDPAPIAAARERRGEPAMHRHEVDLLVRYAWRGLRATVLLKDLTRFGARIEGVEALRKGDGLTLLLPALPACDATVAWAAGRSAGLAFERPLGAADLAVLVRDFAPTDLFAFTPASLAAGQAPLTAKAA